MRKYNGSSTILVTGGAGFLGSHLCDRLVAQGHHVICADNFFTGTKDNIEHLLDHPRFELMRHDVTNPLQVEVDEIYNLACPASPVHYQHDPAQTTKTSVIGAINMLGLARRTGARIFQASTSEVYGDPAFHPQPEGYWGNVNPIGPRSCYDEGEARVEEFFLRAAAQLPERRMLLGRSGWSDKNMPANVQYLGHVYTADHNAFNCTPRAVLNVSRESMARYGFSPATRVFEAAGAAACLITDAWEGVEVFFEPGTELLVAHSGDEVAEHVRTLEASRAREIGHAAFRRVLSEHTYAHRAAQLDTVLEGCKAAPVLEVA